MESVQTERRAEPARASAAVTVIVPAYNEASSIAATVRSLRSQTLPPARIVVVDDCSDDGTDEIAEREGAVVVKPPKNTGSKAGAQNFALPLVETPFTLTIDADTTLAPDALEKIMAAFSDDRVAAACGFVLPQRVRSMWERGRYLEYMFAFNFYKPIQDYYEKPLISSGCFSAYRTKVLRELGGWSTQTMAEDMDLTWTLYQRGWKVRFVPEAISYPLEPHDHNFMRKQLKRWSHGFVQNVRLHWRDILHLSYLRSVVAVAFWDALVASLAVLIVIPLLAIMVSPLFLLGYLIDAPAILIPAVIGGIKRRELGRVLACYPGFLLLRMVNSWFMLKAMWSELLVGRTLSVYEKGH
ncbi:MAG TPA: glycosyltransferase [Actinomycetota bacterium]|nr:glycosyltransferase [Actinomycetota bacterium]